MWQQSNANTVTVCSEYKTNPSSEPTIEEGQRRGNQGCRPAFDAGRSSIRPRMSTKDITRSLAQLRRKGDYGKATALSLTTDLGTVTGFNIVKWQRRIKSFIIRPYVIDTLSIILRDTSYIHLCRIWFNCDSETPCGILFHERAERKFSAAPRFHEIIRSSSLHRRILKNCYSICVVRCE